MTLTLLTMGSVLAVWGLLWMVATGFGLGLAAVFRWRRLRPAERVAIPLLGYVAVLGLLQIWHLFFPVTTLTLAMVAGAGLTFFVVSTIRSSTEPGIAPLSSWLRSIPWLLIPVWLANRSLGPNTLWDSGLYHLPFIRWSTSFAIVPGLGNLHDRLAFNNPSLLFHAMLEPGSHLGLSAHLVNGFLCALWVPALVWSLRAVFEGRIADAPAAVFGITSTVMVTAAATTTWISSTSTDVPALLLAVAGCRQALLFLSDLEERPHDGRGRTGAALALVLLTGAAVVKTSNVVLFLSVAVVMLVARHRRIPSASRSSVMGRPAIFCVVLLAVWTGRGVILSGYPLYPATVAGAPLEWRIDPDTAGRQREAIRHTARSPHAARPEVGDEKGWFGHWALRVVLLRAPVLLGLPLLITACVGVFVLLTRRARDALKTPEAGLAIAVSTAIAAWFLLAPAPRFGAHLWWMLAGLALGYVVRSVLPTSARTRPVVLAVASSLLLAPVVHQMVLIQLRYRHLPDGPYAGSSAWRELPFLTVEGFPEPVPKVPVTQRETSSGLDVLLPIEGFLCWDAPLLCTTPPSFDPGLRLRDPNHLGSGFTTTAKPGEARGPGSRPPL